VSPRGMLPACIRGNLSPAHWKLWRCASQASSRHDSSSTADSRVRWSAGWPGSGSRRRKGCTSSPNRAGWAPPGQVFCVAGTGRSWARTLLPISMTLFVMLHLTSPSGPPPGGTLSTWARGWCTTGEVSEAGEGALPGLPSRHHCWTSPESTLKMGPSPPSRERWPRAGRRRTDLSPPWIPGALPGTRPWSGTCAARPEAASRARWSGDSFGRSSFRTGCPTRRGRFAPSWGGPTACTAGRDSSWNVDGIRDQCRVVQGHGARQCTPRPRRDAATLRYGWHAVTRDPCGVAAQLATALRPRGWDGVLRRCRRCPGWGGAADLVA